MKSATLVKGVISFGVLVWLAIPQVWAVETPLKNWEFSRSIEVKNDAKQATAVELDGKIYDSSRPDLDDLRIMSPQDGEEPYTIRTQREVNKTRKLVSKVLSNETKAQETVLSIDLGEKVENYNEIKLIPKHNNFYRKINMEGSQDNQNWEVIRKGIGKRLQIGKSIRS